MQKRKLGNSNLEVSAIGLGCMGMSFGYGPAGDKQEMIALIRSAVEQGVTFFDTAEVYGPFTNEELVGEALAPFRRQVVIATKFGFDSIPTRRQAGRPEQPARAHQAGGRGLAQAAQDRCRSICSTSIASTRTCRSRTWPGAVKELIQAGKVKHFGLSEAGARNHPPRARRPAGHGVAERIFAVVARAGSGGVSDAGRTGHRLRAVQSAGQGFSDRRNQGGHEIRAMISAISFRVSRRRNRKANQALVDLHREFAAQKKATPAQIALAWMLAQKPWIVPIPGTTKLHRLTENCGAAAVQIAPEELRVLEIAAAKIPVQGARYPEHLQKLVGR